MNGWSGWAKVLITAIVVAMGATYGQGVLRGGQDKAIEVLDKRLDAACKDIDKNEMTSEQNRVVIMDWVNRNRELLSDLNARIQVLSERLEAFRRMMEKLESNMHRE